MYKNILIIIFSTILLNNCGYSPIYSKNTDKRVNIKLVNFNGDREINNSIRYNLKRYSTQNDELNFFIETNSEYTKNSETKNLAGNTISYNLSASVEFIVLYGDNRKIFKFAEKTTLQNIESQMDENVYETNIKKNFGEQFSNRLITQLVKMK
tara:strand:- start:1472 stop:1930 length:459 start_codon:yes stop_codon:yes gene_type:complete